MLSLWGHCPHCCPYLGATPVAEPVRAVRSHQQAHGGLALALQGSPATRLVHAATQNWMEEELL